MSKSVSESGFLSSLLSAHAIAEWTVETILQCLDFMNAKNLDELEFPITLTVSDRKQVHGLCMRAGIRSASNGTGDQRRIMIFRMTKYAGSSAEEHIAQCKNRWSIEKAQAWYSDVGWIVGCNFIPSNAANQLEMWQAETFDAATCVTELCLARSLGFNALRVYLHDLLWISDREAFVSRINTFLSITERFGMHVILVLFDDCHHGDAMLGPQPPPIPGVHNSRWLQSPGVSVAKSFGDGSLDEAERSRLEYYVKDVLRTFSDDKRVLMWDLYNEAGMNNSGDESHKLLQAVWAWADSVRPSQPLSACIDGSVGPLNQRLNSINSDIITFHWYIGDTFAQRVECHIRNAEGRPIICTEFMARELGSTFQLVLPLCKSFNVGCLCWGLVSGKTQTIYNWATGTGTERHVAAAVTSKSTTDEEGVPADDGGRSESSIANISESSSSNSSSSSSSDRRASIIIPTHTFEDSGFEVGGRRNTDLGDLDCSARGGRSVEFVWFHDIFQSNGDPYDSEEMGFIKSVLLST